MQRLLDRPGEPVEAGIEITGDVHSQGAPAAFGKDVEVAARLRLLYDPKRV